MENGTTVQSLHPTPGVVPQMENACTVQSLQPPPPGDVPQIENCCTVQSLQACVGQQARAAAGLTPQVKNPQPAPPPASGGRMVSGMTLIPRSLIFGMSLLLSE